MCNTSTTVVVQAKSEVFCAVVQKNGKLGLIFNYSGVCISRGRNNTFFCQYNKRKKKKKKKTTTKL